MSNLVKFWRGTQEEYDKIPVKDKDCIYIVIAKGQ